MATNRSAFEALLDKFEPTIRNAFLAAIMDIRSQVTLKRLVERLERGDVAGALDVLQIDREAFGAFELALADAFNAGGTGFASELKLRDPQGQRVVFRFGVRNPEAEAWLRDHSASLVTRIVEDQRNMIRTVLVQGLADGQNPRRSALDVVGRISRATGKREGGLIGLTGPQERFVASARSELTSGDLAGYLARERRDKRFDRTIAAAIKSGKPLDAATVDRIVGRYADRLLALRGEMLARSETLAALNGSRHQAMKQAIAQGKVDARYVTKTWRSAHDSRVRFTHAVLSGQKVGLDDAFVSPSGARLLFPGDPSAPAHETVGCRCYLSMEVDYIGQFAARRAA